MHHRAETGKADWTKYDRTWHHRLLYFQSSVALCAELRLEWLLPPSGHKVAAELTYAVKENRVRTLLSSEVQPASTTLTESGQQGRTKHLLFTEQIARCDMYVSVHMYIEDEKAIKSEDVLTNNRQLTYGPTTGTIRNQLGPEGKSRGTGRLPCT